MIVRIEIFQLEGRAQKHAYFSGSEPSMTKAIDIKHISRNSLQTFFKNNLNYLHISKITTVNSNLTAR